MQVCKNILIVEDDAAVRQMMKDILEIQGYEVETASDGKEGIDKLRSKHEHPCVVLLDMMMPRMNGWQFLDIQRSDPNYSKIPVVICSAYHEIAQSVRAEAVIEKPIRLDSLLNTVKSFCA